MGKGFERSTPPVTTLRSFDAIGFIAATLITCIWGEARFEPRPLPIVLTEACRCLRKTTCEYWDCASIRPRPLPSTSLSVHQSFCYSTPYSLHTDSHKIPHNSPPEVITLYTCIMEFVSSNLGRDTIYPDWDCPDFPLSLQAYTRIVP
jgi:hypothetical protein